MPLDRRTLLLGALAVAVGCSTTVSSSPPASGLPSDSAEPAPAPVPGGVPNPASPGQSSKRTSVGMIGDSITAASTDALKAVFTKAGFVHVDVDADTGRRIEEGSGKQGDPLAGTKVLAKLLDRGVDPDVWVIALGTNDVGQYDSKSGDYERL